MYASQSAPGGGRPKEETKDPVERPESIQPTASNLSHHQEDEPESSDGRRTADGRTPDGGAAADNAAGARVAVQVDDEEEEEEDNEWGFTKKQMSGTLL